LFIQGILTEGEGFSTADLLCKFAYFAQKGEKVFMKTRSTEQVGV
jgi:hypothetical protein